MNVEFYKCSDDPRVLNKSLQNVATVNCQIYDSCSILAPVLMLRYDSNIMNSNYIRIPDWNRFYYINNINVDNAKTMYVTAAVDVLNTYKEQILNCNATAIRNENTGTTYVPDSSFPLYPCSDFVTSLAIGTYETAGTYHYILTTK